MSRIRANKITDKLGTGAIELEKGAHLPIGMGITGAGGLNITGVITATSFSGSGANLTGIDATAIKDSGGNVKIQAQASGAVYTGIHTFTTLNATSLTGTLQTAAQPNITSVGTLSSLNVSGSVSVGGTLTYEDVTNIDSVGIVTAREGIFIPDTKELKIGNTATSPDLKIHHSSGTNIINSANGDLNFQHSNNDKAIITGGSLKSGLDGSIDLGESGAKWQNVHAVRYYGDGSNLTGITVGITTEALVKTNGQTASLDLSKDDHKVTATGTVTIDVTGGSEADSHTLRIVNSGIATVGFSTYFLFPSGGTPSLPTTSGAISLISFTVHRAGAVGVSTQLISGASLNFS